jgi:hypothetical protein
VDDLRDIANTQHPEPDELVARWQGLGDAIDGDAKNDCATEAGKAREHFEQEARSKLDDAKAKIDRALSGQSGDFDAALKALSDFPVNLRASAAWIKDGAPRQDELLRRRDAFVAGTALLKEAKRVWDSDHDAEAIQGIYAAFPDDYRTTEEGKSIADEFSKLLSDAAHVAIGAASDKARAEREKKDAENFEKSCAKRARVVAESEGNFRMELDDKPGAALFDWQVRPDMVDREKLPNDAIRCVGGHLVLKNEESSSRSRSRRAPRPTSWARCTAARTTAATPGTSSRSRAPRARRRPTTTAPTCSPASRTTPPRPSSSAWWARIGT